MYLKTDKIVATIGNVTMRSYATGTGNEFILDPVAFDGWLDGASVRRTPTQRLRTDGDFSEPATFGARIISFSGTAVAKSRNELRAMRDDLTGVIPNGEYKELSVDTMGTTRTTTVGLEGNVSFIRQSDTFASFRITFYAPDPYIYGPWKTFQTGAGKTNRGGLQYNLQYPLNFNLTGVDVAQTIKNNGNAVSWPIFKVTGNYSEGFTVYNNVNKAVEYTQVVTTESPVIVDMGKGTVTQNGGDRSIFLARRQWFSIAPGQTLQPEFIPNSSSGANGSGWCDILYRDTWI